MPTAREYRKLVEARLDGLTRALVAELNGRILRRRYHPSTRSLAFEVHFDRLDTRVPIVGYELDEGGDQTGFARDGSILMTAPISILRGKRVLSKRELQPFVENSVETAELSAPLLMKWFRNGWRQAETTHFALSVTLALHDDTKVLDLKTRRWRRR